jgi:hypothetical protein
MHSIEQELGRLRHDRSAMETEAKDSSEKVEALQREITFMRGASSTSISKAAIMTQIAAVSGTLNVFFIALLCLCSVSRKARVPALPLFDVRSASRRRDD